MITWNAKLQIHNGHVFCHFHNYLDNNFSFVNVQSLQSVVSKTRVLEGLRHWDIFVVHLHILGYAAFGIEKSQIFEINTHCIKSNVILPPLESHGWLVVLVEYLGVTSTLFLAKQFSPALSSSP
jgi:hypothetical protein